MPPSIPNLGPDDRLRSSGPVTTSYHPNRDGRQRSATSRYHTANPTAPPPPGDAGRTPGRDACSRSQQQPDHPRRGLSQRLTPSSLAFAQHTSSGALRSGSSHPGARSQAHRRHHHMVVRGQRPDRRVCCPIIRFRRCVAKCNRLHPCHGRRSGDLRRTRSARPQARPWRPRSYAITKPVIGAARPMSSKRIRPRFSAANPTTAHA